MFNINRERKKSNMNQLGVFILALQYVCFQKWLEQWGSLIVIELAHMVVVIAQIMSSPINMSVKWGT